MAFTNQDEEIECTIIESYGIFSQGIRFWNKEVNLVSWNRRQAKLDIRNWQRDHKKCGKGIAITREEAENLVKLLNEILKKKPKAEKAGPRRTSKEPKTSSEPKNPSGPGTSKQVPKTLEPFFRELKLAFGADPAACKTARNILLKKYHPDIYAGNNAVATRKTIKVKEAYERILSWWNENRGKR